jgi:hypothetical protein
VTNADGVIVHCPHADHTPLCRCASDRRVLDERVVRAEEDAKRARSQRYQTWFWRVLLAALAISAIAIWSGGHEGTDRPQRGAVCHDGWVSGADGQGACSHHGGVRRWIWDGQEVCSRADLTAQRLGELLPDYQVPAEATDCVRNPWVLGMHGDD